MSLLFIFETILIVIACFSFAVLILSKQPVQSVLSLVLAALSLSGFSLIGEAEFLSFIILIVYIGAVAVLFLFVVMMINVRELPDEETPFFISLFSLGLVLFIQFFFILTDLLFFVDISQYVPGLNYIPPLYNTANYYLSNNNISLFILLYITNLFFVVIAAGILLLVGIIGSIFLTVQDYSNSKSQLIYAQVSRDSGIYSYRG